MVSQLCCQPRQPWWRPSPLSIQRYASFSHVQGLQSRLTLGLGGLDKRCITCIWKGVACIRVRNLHACSSRYADPANSQVHTAVVERLHAAIGANLKLPHHHVRTSPVCYAQLSICTDESNGQVFEQLRSALENYPLSTDQVGVAHTRNALETAIQAVLVALYHTGVDSRVRVTLRHTRDKLEQAVRELDDQEAETGKLDDQEAKTGKGSDLDRGYTSRLTREYTPWDDEDEQDVV